MRKPLQCFVALWLFAGVNEVFAGGNQAVVGYVYPCKPVTTPIRIDGKLDADEWSNAIEVSGFTYSGKESLANEQMVMRLLYDREKLYLGVKCSESSMAALVTNAKVHDDNVWDDDCIEFFIDPRHDHENYYQFAVNTVAARYDAVGFDRTWNCEWDAAVFKDKDAWYVEAAIPFSAFKLKTPEPGYVMGFNLNRERLASGSRELYNWADVQGNFHKPGLFGHLMFVEDSWKPDATSIAEIAQRVGTPETRVFVADGYWEVKERGKPKFFSYRELIQTQKGSVENYLQELRRMYTDRPAMPLKDQFAKVDARYQEIKGMTSGVTAITPEVCAGANVFLNNLESTVKDIYWRVRVKLLLEKY